MNNFVNVVHKLEELSARDSNKAKSLNLLNSTMYQVRADMDRYLSAQTSDLHRLEDLADVLGYSGRVVAADETIPVGDLDPSIYGATVFSNGDYFLVKGGAERGIYPIVKADDGAGTVTYSLDTNLVHLLNDVAVVVLKLVVDELVQKHSILNLSNGVWHERVIV